MRSQQSDADVVVHDHPPVVIKDGDSTFAWPDNDVIKGKVLYRRYYRLQRIVSKEEWNSFEESLFQPLPITFRYAGCTNLEFRTRGERLLESMAEEGFSVRRLAAVDGWQLDGVDKHTLRRALPGSSAAMLRQWLIEGTDGGSLVRQEVASMLPALLARVEPSHVVLDMCASPGSKTTHVVDLMTRKLAGLSAADAVPTGLVVANDADPVRAYTLVKRCLSAVGAAKACVLVSCHRGQRFPRVSPDGGDGGDGSAHAGQYDRILCDVPCTGDGTVRKNPEVFSRWEPELAFRMHETQLQIALRALQLLRVGGTMVYSTCSLNPIEDEAVVAELLRRSRGAVMLQDAVPSATELVGECARGMTSWRVIDGALFVHPHYDSAEVGSTHTARRLCRSMWPPSPDESSIPLERCVRLFPHLSNTGGFFVALLTKTAPLPGPLPRWPRAADTTPRPIVTTRKARSHHYLPIDHDLAVSLATAFFGPKVRAASLVWLKSVLFARSEVGKRIVYMNRPCSHHCSEPRLNVVHGGTTVFLRMREGPAREAHLPANVRTVGNSLWKMTLHGDILLGDKLKLSQKIKRARE